MSVVLLGCRLDCMCVLLFVMICFVLLGVGWRRAALLLHTPTLHPTYYHNHLESIHPSTQLDLIGKKQDEQLQMRVIGAMPNFGSCSAPNRPNMLEITASEKAH